MREFDLIPDTADEGMRLDAYLVKKLESLLDDISRSLIGKYKYNIFVNGVNKKLSFKIKAGSNIKFILPPPKKIELIPKDVDFTIVYEDDDIIVIDKPAGLVVHPAKGNYDVTLVHGILNKIDDLGSFNNVLRPGIVHRLDKDTSGLIIVCKNIKSHKAFSDMFKNRDITKTYLAIVASDKLPLKGIIDRPIGRHPVYRKKFTVKEGGKISLTEYEVLYKEKGHSLVKINLLTGRTHQIRVHFSSIGAPLAGDIIYGKKNSKYETAGLALVAYALNFINPISGKSLSLSASLPAHFKSLLKELELFYGF